MQARRKNFHVPLDEDVYLRLKGEAERAGKPATELAREAIEASLAERRRAELGESIASYAVEVAGTSDDLDRDLEQAALVHLVKPRRRRR
jgi:predicted DNA-binding protein